MFLDKKCATQYGNFLVLTQHGSIAVEYIDQIVDGIRFENLIITLFAMVCSIAISQLGGIPLADTKIGFILWLLWEICMMAQFACMFLALIICIIAPFSALSQLKSCLVMFSPGPGPEYGAHVGLGVGEALALILARLVNEDDVDDSIGRDNRFYRFFIFSCIGLSTGALMGAIYGAIFLHPSYFGLIMPSLILHPIYISKFFVILIYSYISMLGIKSVNLIKLETINTIISRLVYGILCLPLGFFCIYWIFTFSFFLGTFFFSRSFF